MFKKTAKTFAFQSAYLSDTDTMLHQMAFESEREKLAYTLHLTEIERQCRSLLLKSPTRPRPITVFDIAVLEEPKFFNAPSKYVVYVTINND